MTIHDRLRAVALLVLLLGGCTCARGPAPDWSRHDAHRSCRPAIEAYPESPAPPCQAMHMCMDEAKLTAAEQAKLMAMIRATRGCGDP